MPIKQLFTPEPTITARQLKHGLRMHALEGAASLGFASITTGGMMAAYALSLGANNFQIGAIAAIPFLLQLLQIPFIALVERVKRRKLIAVTSWLVAQAFWIPIALIPLFLPAPGSTAIYLLLGLLAVRGVFAAATNCSWNSWIRDLIPRQTLGRTLARRLAVTTVVSTILGLSGALFIDWWVQRFPSAPAAGYGWLFLSGAILLGLASPMFMARMPEPLMQSPAVPQMTLGQLLMTPFQDKNFRRLTRFLFLWTFGANLAIPFFAVYMLRRLDMPLTQVMLMTMLSQVSNLLFLRVWGTLSDRFGSKAVLSLSISLYTLVFLGWVFTTLPDRYALTIPLLSVLHVFIGVATAGLNVTTTTIGMKLAPAGQATAYLAMASLAINVGTGLGPLAGGPLSDFFSQRTLNLTIAWAGPHRTLQLPALHVTGFDFLFLIAFVLGLLTLGVLATVREEGEVSRELLLDELWARTRSQFREVSSAPRVGLAEFPSGFARIPGLDVAIGVTAYQVASLMKGTVEAVQHGQRALARISEGVGDALSNLVDGVADLWNYGFELSRQSVRGAIHAADAEEDCGPITAEAVKGVCRGLEKTSAKTVDVLFGAGYGAVQGATEAKTDLKQAVAGAVEGAKQVAQQIGLDKEKAATAAAQGLLTAVHDISPQAVMEIESTLKNDFPELGSIMPNVPSESRKALDAAGRQSTMTH